MHNNKYAAISYTGVVLDKTSHNRLVDMVSAMPQVQGLLPELGKPVAHHLTLTLGELQDPELKEFLGQEGEITCTHLGISDKSIAVKCSSEVRFSNGTINWESMTKKGNGKFPHITVYVNKGAGGRPVDSNNITDFISLKQPLKLQGTVVGVEQQPPQKN